MDSSTNTDAASESGSTQTNEATTKGGGSSTAILSTEKPQDIADGEDLDSISPRGEQPYIVHKTQFHFEVPFQRHDNVIVRNGLNELWTSSIMSKNRSRLMRDFMESNFPEVPEIHVKFTVGASWAGDQFSTELAIDLRWCVEATLPMMKQCRFILDVEYPFPHSSDFQGAMLLLLRQKNLLVFHSEARKIDENFELLME